MLQIIVRDGVVIRYPWSNRGFVMVEQYDAEGKLVERVSSQRVLNTAGCETALRHARATAAELAGQDNYAEICEPPRDIAPTVTKSGDLKL